LTVSVKRRQKSTDIQVRALQVYIARIQFAPVSSTFNSITVI